MAWWSRKREGERQLLSALIEAETRRAEAHSKIETQRLQNEQHRMELEYEHLEAASEQRRKDAEAREELRQKRREWSATAREKAKQNKQARLPGVQSSAQPETCPVCRNAGDPRLTANEIKAHYAHLDAAPRQQQN